MMFDSILVKVSCSEELLYLHTISRRHKSPYRFAILRDTLEQLEREPGRYRCPAGQSYDVAREGCYAALRLTRALDGEMLVIRFSWLQSAGADSLRGYEEWVRLPYRRFHECVEAGTDMAGWNWSQLSVPEKVTRRFEFHSRQNLHVKYTYLSSVFETLKRVGPTIHTIDLMLPAVEAIKEEVKRWIAVCMSDGKA